MTLAGILGSHWLGAVIVYAVLALFAYLVTEKK
jgi:hypothetical protein